MLARKKSIIEDSVAIDKVDESENNDNDLEKVDNTDENKIEDEEK